jgi:hypothetical protein
VVPFSSSRKIEGEFNRVRHHEREREGDRGGSTECGCALSREGDRGVARRERRSRGDNPRNNQTIE